MRRITRARTEWQFTAKELLPFVNTEQCARHNGDSNKEPPFAVLPEGFVMDVEDKLKLHERKCLPIPKGKIPA